MPARKTTRKTTRKATGKAKGKGARKTTRRTPARRKVARKPARKSGRKAGGGTARKRTPRSQAVAPARKKAAKTTRRRSAPRTASGGMEAVARRIVRAGIDPAKFVIADLYTPDCTSQEASGEVVRGHAGLEQKLRQWESMQSHAVFRARNVWTGPKTVCVEWEGKVTLRDGRTVDLEEVAVHHIRNGKIHAERYYYNPMALMPPQG